MKDILEFSKLSDEELVELLKRHKIGLSVSEARHVTELLGRDPSLTEATVWGIQGSEHCSYKSSRKHLRGFPIQAPNVIVPVGEDSGIFSLTEMTDANGKTERYGVIVAHESHNHPSQIVPFEGASTGVGGIVRDICCMGGRVVGTLDSLRFGDITKNQSKWIAGGVFAGISGYGNPIGVPNLGGDTFFHAGYNENCLVNVVAVGTVRESDAIHSYVPDEAADRGYDFIAVGKPTDRSGMGGASFASASFGSGSEEELEAKKSAVQEPNPFLKRHLLVSTYDLFKELRERGWINKVAFKDLGAGGNICSTVELVAKKGFGAQVDLEKIHTAYPGLPAGVIACSETQERFMWACDPEISEFILNHYNVKWNLPLVCENARASKIGKVAHGNYVLKYNGEVMCDAKSEHITEGFLYDRPYETALKALAEPAFEMPKDLSRILIEMLSSENIALRKTIYEKYDKQVQGLVTIESGESDASVMQPFLDHEELGEKRYVGLASSVAGNPFYGDISAYWQGANAVVASMRAVAAVGAYPQALTDCLNYGNPEKPDQMAQLVDGIRGISDALKGIHLKNHPAFATPVVSGNVSLYNEGAGGGIPPSAILACFGKIEDSRKAVTMKLKGVPGEVDARSNISNTLFLIGERRDECGASEYYRTLARMKVLPAGSSAALGANVPQPDFTTVEREIFALSDAVEQSLVLSAHAISEGGLAVAVAEMCVGPYIETADGLKGCVGAMIDIDAIPGKDTSGAELRPDKKLFSETGGFVVEVEPARVATFIETCQKQGVVAHAIGQTVGQKVLAVSGGDMPSFSLAIEELAEAWSQGLREKLR